VKKSEVGIAVTIIIGQRRSIVDMSPIDRTRRKRKDVPGSSGRTPQRRIGYIGAGGVIAGNCHVAHPASHTGGREAADVTLDEPCTSGRTPHGQVGLAIAVIIAGLRGIAKEAPLHCSQLSGKTVENQPLSGTWAPER